MTIDEAIKILNRDIADPGSVSIEDVNEAEELGIEALIRVRDDRGTSYSSVYQPTWDPLPSETEE